MAQAVAQAAVSGREAASVPFSSSFAWGLKVGSSVSASLGWVVGAAFWGCEVLSFGLLSPLVQLRHVWGFESKTPYEQILITRDLM